MAKRDDGIDALFKLPLTEFIGERKKLAAQLKKNGAVEEAKRVNALQKPSVSAWTVNQLYWTQREAFDELIATGQRLRKAQASGKMVNMREALDARRAALSHLSDLATEVLTDAGHNPSLDTLRRITSTLEALSAATSSEGPAPGRLTQDVDPPGFDSFGSFVASVGTAKPVAAPPRITFSKKPDAALSKSKPKTSSNAEASRREERQARINSAKVSLKDARKSLAAARTTVKSLEAARTRAEAVAKEADKQKRQAAERFKKASVASENAAQRIQSIEAELGDAIRALQEAERTAEIATRELEASFREPPASIR